MSENIPALIAEADDYAQRGWGDISEFAARVSKALKRRAKRANALESLSAPSGEDREALWETVYGVLQVGPVVDSIVAAILSRFSLPAEVEWEYQCFPITAVGEEWVGRSREACEELIAEHANPDHYIHQPHNDDMSPVVRYRVERRVKAGPWVPVEKGAEQ